MIRIELTPSAWKAEALPICNIRIVLDQLVVLLRYHFYTTHGWAASREYPTFSVGRSPLVTITSRGFLLPSWTTRARTWDLEVNSFPLCRLSYGPIIISILNNSGKGKCVRKKCGGSRRERFT